MEAEIAPKTLSVHSVSFSEQHKMADIYGMYTFYMFGLIRIACFPVNTQTSKGSSVCKSIRNQLKLLKYQFLDSQDILVCYRFCDSKHCQEMRKILLELLKRVDEFL